MPVKKSSRAAGRSGARSVATPGAGDVHTARRASKLMKIGGSVTAAIPKHVLETLALEPGSRIRFEARDGKLVGTPAPVTAAKKRIGYAARLARCKLDQRLSAKRTDEDEAWLSSPPKGREVI